MFKKVLEPLESNLNSIYLDLQEETIGQKIYKIRKLKGWSRREFVKIFGIGYNSLCKYETGLSNPNKENINKICKALNISKEYLKRE